MEPVPHRETSSHGDGLRALVDLASGDVAGQPERFLLPDGPREAAALACVGAVRRDLARLVPDDPLRSVAGQMAQDKAAHAVPHRAADRAAADELQAALRSRRQLDRRTRHPESRSLGRPRSGRGAPC